MEARGRGVGLVRCAIGLAWLLVSCGHTRPSWRGGVERVATLTPAEAALMERMSTDVPTPDATVARMAIGDVHGEPSTEQIERLVESSVRWIEHLHASGALDRMRRGECRAASPREKGDVISTLSAEAPAELAHAGDPGALDAAWIWPHRDVVPECERSERAMRAVATTRAWLEMRIVDLDVLAPFRETAERIAGRPGSCIGASDPVVDATLRFFFELRALPAIGETSLGEGICHDVATLEGPAPPVDQWATSVVVRASVDADAPDHATAELALLGCSGGSGWVVELLRTPHGWRVVGVSPIVCILTAGCRG